MDNGETKDRGGAIDTLSIRGVDPFLVKSRSGRGGREWRERPFLWTVNAGRSRGREIPRLNDSDAFGIMWRVIARARCGLRNKRKKRSAFALGIGKKKKCVSKKSALSANNRIAPACCEIEKYRAKSAQTSILNCRRGRAFAEGAGITGLPFKGGTNELDRVTMARWLVSFARWRS